MITYIIDIIIIIIIIIIIVSRSGSPRRCNAQSHGQHATVEARERKRQRDKSTYKAHKCQDSMPGKRMINTRAWRLRRDHISRRTTHITTAVEQ